MPRKSFCKQVLISLISFMLIFSFIFVDLSVCVNADSQSRTKNWIALGAEKSTVSSLGTDEFSYDEMRIIGIFLSNYYIPWSTQINNKNDSSADDKTKENMITALTDSLNFDQSVAEGLVNAVYSMSESSAKELYIDFGDKTAKCSYANLISAFFSDEHEKGTNINVYWNDDNGTAHTVFSGKNEENSPCFYVLSSIMSQLNTKSGYGTAFLGTSEDFESSGKLTSEDVNTWMAQFAANNEALTSCALGQQMYVDCFGNIICDNGQGRAFIVVPACMNPYTFIKDGASAGEAVPVNNLYFMKLNGNGELVSSTPTSVDNLDLSPIEWRGSIESYRIGRGSSTWSFNTSIVPISWGNEGINLLTDMLNVYTESDYALFSFGHFSPNTTDKKIYLWGGGSPIIMEESYNSSVIQDWILFNSIGGFSSENTDTDVMKANDFGIFGKNWGSLRSPVSQSFSTGADKDNAFNMLTDENSKCYLAGIFCSYVFAYFRSDGTQLSAGTSTESVEEASSTESSDSVLSDDLSGDLSGIGSALADATSNVQNGDYIGSTSVSESNDKVAYKINLADLPSGGTGNFSISISDSQMDTQLKSFMYYILHPTDGVAYIKQWFGKLTSSFLLKTHEDIVGNTSTNNTTGGTKYLGFSGYVTVPNLHDLSWTQWLLDKYDSFFIYFVIFMSLVLIGYIFLGSLTFQKGIMSLVVFAICAYLPPTLINTTVDYSNKVCDLIYGSKFTYWALVQHELYVDEINAAVSQASNDSYNDFLLAQFNSQSDYTSNSSTSVALKWSSPKKDNYLVNYQKEMNELSGSNRLMNVISGLVSQRVSGESYLGGDNDMYLYRSYTDLSTYASSSYNWLKSTNNASTVALTSTLTGVVTDSDVDLGNELTSSNYLGNSNKEYSLQYAIDYGFNYSTQGNYYDAQDNYRIIAPLMSTSVSSSIKNGLDNISLSNTSSVGITQNKFNITVSNLNNKDSSVTNDKYGTFVFGEYSESPFYYFSFNLNDQIRYNEGTSFTNEDGYTYKNLFLQGDGDYFYNNDDSLKGSAGYGEIRDYMDMRSLFYCIIPYLKEANDVVRQFDEEYGLWLYDGVDVDTTSDSSELTPPTFDTDSELYYKWWHNVTVCQLYNMYSSWVDTMYDCNYAKPEKITVHGEKFLVKDPLDPYTYYETDANGNISAGRYMVFSESEMQYYGLTYSDLTAVEKKIINVQKNSYEDLLELMDYYSFDDEVLNTASAMIETFNFNKEFSQSSLLGTDYTLYPQNYELKNFTYDAYLRLILVNATGESLQSTDDTGKSVNLYQTILENTSFITGVLMIGLDVIATYAIPALKLFFLLAVFALSIFVIISAILNIQLNIASVMSDSLIKPLLQFFLTSIGMAFAVSLFMSDGNTSVTGRGGYTISLGDPTMTIIVMLVINVVVVVLYWKICKKTFQNCKKYAEAVLTSIAGTATGVLSKVTGVAMAGTLAAKALPSNISNGINRRLQNKANREIANGGIGSGSGMTKKQAKNIDKANKADAKAVKAQNRKDNINSIINKGMENVDSREKLSKNENKQLGKKAKAGDEKAKIRLENNKKEIDKLKKKKSRIGKVGGTLDSISSFSVKRKNQKAEVKSARAGRGDKSTRKK